MKRRRSRRCSTRSTVAVKDAGAPSSPLGGMGFGPGNEVILPPPRPVDLGCPELNR